MLSNSRARWWGLVVISLGVSLIIVDSTIVNVAVPSIIDDIGITSSQAQWVQEIYTLVFAALLLVFGRLADSYGRRRLFALGAAIFGVSSVLAALSQSGGALIGARALQGIGGAMMLPTSLSLLNATFRGRERGIAFGIWGATIGGTAALGPLLGGWLTTSYSWRWAFGINIPLCLIVLVGLGLLVAESRDPSRQGRLDLAGALLSAIGFGGIVFGLIEGRTYGWFTSLTPLTIGSWSWPWSLSPVAVAFLLGGAALTAFFILERRRQQLGEPGMLDLSLFEIPSFRNGNLAAAIVSLGEFGIIFALPLWLQNVLGYTAFETGLILLGLAGGSFLASGLGAVIGRTRSPLFIVRLGIVLEILGIAGLAAFLRPTSTWTVVVPLLIVYGVGVGFATAQLTGVVLADVPVERSGQGSGTQSTARQVGSALGIAILGTVLFLTLTNRFDSALTTLPVSDAQRLQLVDAVESSAGAVIPALAANPATAAVAEAAQVAYTDATRLAALVAAGFLLLGLAASASLGRIPGRHESTAVPVPATTSSEGTA
ncbi:MAG TPA: MFS transporter [Lapillicoccus sp.]